jgi:hypothetical protein
MGGLRVNPTPYAQISYFEVFEVTLKLHEIEHTPGVPVKIIVPAGNVVPCDN